MMKWIVAIGAGLTATLFAYLARGATSKAVGTITGTETSSGASSPQGRVYVQDGRLYGPGGVSVALTETDRLWAGRAVYGETGGADRTAAAAVLWSMAQNLMLVQGASRPRFSSFTNMLRAYCQPINPMWESASSSGCIEHPTRCTASMLARRARIRDMSWSALPATTREAVDAFFAGALDNPVPGMVDFAEASQFPGAQTVIGGNGFGTLSSRRIV